MGHHGSMSWIQVTNFVKRVKEYQALTKKTQAQVASDLGTTYATLRFWMSGVRQPRLDTLQGAAALFKCSVVEFMDDPGQEIAGQDTSRLSDKRRFLAGLMHEGITSDELSDEDAQFLYEDYLAARARLVAMKNRMRPQQDGPT